MTFRLQPLTFEQVVGAESRKVFHGDFETNLVDRTQQQQGSVSAMPNADSGLRRLRIDRQCRGVVSHAVRSARRGRGADRQCHRRGRRPATRATRTSAAGQIEALSARRRRGASSASRSAAAATHRRCDRAEGSQARPSGIAASQARGRVMPGDDVATLRGRTRRPFPPASRRRSPTGSRSISAPHANHGESERRMAPHARLVWCRQSPPAWRRPAAIAQ